MTTVTTTNQLRFENFSNMGELSAEAYEFIEQFGFDPVDVNDPEFWADFMTDGEKVFAVAAEGPFTSDSLCIYIPIDESCKDYEYVMRLFGEYK